jgi:two-component system LytT family response regulator
MTPPQKLRVLVVDDEAPARRKIVRLLREEEKFEVVGEADSGEQAIAAVENLRPDLVFLDVQMPGLDGFGVIEALTSLGQPVPQIIFVTAHDKFALKAFDAHVFDYLLKPVSEERFRGALRRALSQRKQSTEEVASRLSEMIEQLQREKSFPERIFIRENERAFFVLVREITWIESDRNYLLLHCGKKTHTLRATLESLLKSLDPRLFVQLNRGSLVRLDAIRELVPWFPGEHNVMLHDGTEVRWSRRYVTLRPELLKLL